MKKLDYDTTTLVAEILGKAVMWAIFGALSFLSVYYGAFVLREIWGWFAVPAGLVMITKHTSIGVFLIVGLLKASFGIHKTPDDEGRPAYYRGIGALLAYFTFFTMAWGSAAIWHFWLL
jgi:hypothetical protein